MAVSFSDEMQILMKLSNFNYSDFPVQPTTNLLLSVQPTLQNSTSTLIPPTF